MKSSSARQFSPLVVAIAAILVVAGLHVVLRMFAYASTPDRPFGFYYDLGVNDVATAYIRHAIHSWRDFIDNVGWASWADVPNFNFNPTTSYFVLVPLANLIGNEWQAVKIVQVLQQVLAFLSMATLYATLRRRDLWALAAGLLYAVLPSTALMIRGNVDIGWPIALTPLAIAIGYALVRRYGVWALPLCGVVCGLFGFCFASEFLFFCAIPAYLFVCIAAFSKKGFLPFALAAVVGLVFLGFIGSFFALPTIGDRSQFSDPAARTSSLQNGSELALFSESWPALFGLIPVEFVISNVAAFNAGRDLSLVFPATFSVWAFAAWATWRAARSSSLSAKMGAVLGAILVVVSLGTVLPFGEQLWRLLFALPGFAMIRTPDRFLVLPLILVIYTAASSLSRLSQSNRPLAQIGSPVLLAAILGLFLAFDSRQGWLALDPQADYVEPDLAAVAASVSVAGGRTISYAFVRNGSQFYTPAYGVPTPTLGYFWDPSSFYASDGIRGYGIFVRGAVHTAVASPNWSFDSPSLPDAQQISGAFPGKVLFAGKSGIIVKRIGERSALSVVTPMCVAGGAGLLDWATALPQLSGYAFVRDSASCDRHAYLNYDPRDVFERREVASYAAGPLFADEPPVRDADYSFLVGRTFINDSWYRNSIDGDDVSSLGGARNLTHGRSFSLQLPGNSGGASRSLLLRLASRVSTRIDARDSTGWTGSVPIEPGYGMRWFELALPHNRVPRTLTLRIEPFPAAVTAGGTWAGIAFDRATLVERAAQPPATDGSNQDVALYPVSSFADRRVRRSVWIPAGGFTAHLYGIGMEEHAPLLSIDGKSSSDIVSFAHGGYHELALTNTRDDDRVLALIGARIAVNTVVAANAIQNSTFDWRVTNARRATIELASFDDGNWLLDDVTTGAYVATGKRCDLINTCFMRVPAGTFRIHHEWQPMLKIGILTTLGTAFLALSVLALSLVRWRTPAKSSAQKSILSLG